MFCVFPLPLHCMTRSVCPWWTRRSFCLTSLADVFEKAEAQGKTRKRRDVTTALADVFEDTWRQSPGDLVSCVRLAACDLGVEVGVGRSVLSSALCVLGGIDATQLRKQEREAGDWGAVVALWKREGEQRKGIHVADAFQRLCEVAATTGNKSVSLKCDLLVDLLSSCNSTEAAFLVRWIEGRLRAGIARSTVLTALGWAAARMEQSDEGEGAVRVLQAFHLVPSYEHLVSIIQKAGLEGVRHCHLVPGVPVQPMLAVAARALPEAVTRVMGCEDRHDGATAEFKYDGVRVQIHRTDTGTLHMFSRTRENIAGQFSDFLPLFSGIIKSDVRTFVLDGEIVATDPLRGHILPFQVLQARPRKSSPSNTNTRFTFCFFAFDLLYLNGESLLHVPLRIRRKHLQDNFSRVAGVFDYASAWDLKGDERDSVFTQLKEFFQFSLRRSCEGLLIKSLQSEYEPGIRSTAWIKVKKDYMEHMGDSVDLVPVAGFYGKGKRGGRFGSFLMACMDARDGTFSTICKVGTGFTDDLLERISAELKDHGTTTQPENVHVATRMQKPDEWFIPSMIWEIRAANLTLSSTHTAGRDQMITGRGIGLRFPRFVRLRRDKSLSDATTSDQIVAMYQQQF